MIAAHISIGTVHSVIRERATLIAPTEAEAVAQAYRRFLEWRPMYAKRPDADWKTRANLIICPAVQDSRGHWR